MLDSAGDSLSQMSLNEMKALFGRQDIRLSIRSRRFSLQTVNKCPYKGTSLVRAQ